MDVVRFVSTLLLAYVLGSIPSGLIIGKVIKGVDIREFGSGKTGATNALRTLGKAPAALVLCADLAKGVLAVWVAYLLVGTAAAACLAGLAAAIGHNWPVFAGFRGGRGVLVSIGIFWVLCWPAALVTCCIGIVVIAFSRIVSLGVLCGALIGVLSTIPLVLKASYSPWVLLYAVAGATLIVVRHHDNIARLRDGTERKLGQPAQPVA